MSFFFFFSLRHGSSANQSKLGPVFWRALILSHISSYLEISWALRRYSRPSSDLLTLDTVNIDSVTVFCFCVKYFHVPTDINEKDFATLFLLWCKQFFKAKQKNSVFPIDTIKKKWKTKQAYKSVFSKIQVLKNIYFHLSLSKQLPHI